MTNKEQTKDKDTTQAKTNAAAVLSEKLKNKAITPSNAITENTPIQVARIEPSVPVEEVRWQQYTSARRAIRTFTDKGKSIKFTNYEYFTREKDVAMWLDSQIAINGLPGVTKGKLLTSSERDPMEVLRKQHIAEYLKDQEQIKVDAAKGLFPDMGSTERATNLNPASSKGVASGASA